MTAIPDGVELREASTSDLPAIERLLAGAGLPVPAPCGPPVRFVVASRGGEVVACAGNERHGSACALLRSVAVAPGERAHGIGRALVQRALDGLAREGVLDVTLVTLHASGFFARLGFQAIARDDVPAPVRASPELAAHCCASGTWMRRVALAVFADGTPEGPERLIDRLPNGPFLDSVGVRTEVVGEGRTVSRVLAEGRHENALGAVHGGVVYTLVDTGMGRAVASVLDACARCATLSATIQYIEPAPRGELVAASEIVHRGSKVATCRSEVRDATGRLCAVAVGSYYISAAAT